MTDQSENTLEAGQLQVLTQVFHRGAADASVALEKWLRFPSVMTVDSVDQVPLHEATTILGADEEPVCFCGMAIRGLLTGQLIFVFDESSGLALADLVLGRNSDTSTERGWSDVETSAALETANVIGCAYLNSLHKHLPGTEGAGELIPSPPQFQRDYPQALLQFALMSQLLASDTVFLSESHFHVDQTPLDWTLLLIPDGPSIETLSRLLPS